VGPGATLDGCVKSPPPTEIRSPDRPARSESLYRLSYDGPMMDHMLSSNASIENVRSAVR